MLPLPRLAVGAIQGRTDLQPMLLGLLTALAHRGLRAQTFQSRSCFSPGPNTLAAAGQTIRHLDAWAMTRGVCRELFLHNAARGDLSIVQGQFCSKHEPPLAPCGHFERLCEWLELPAVGVLDARRIKSWCCLPTRPRTLDALLIDNVQDANHFLHMQTTLEGLWGVPVLGGMETLTSLRSSIANAPPGTELPAAVEGLGRSFEKLSRLDRLQSLAARRPFTCEPGWLYDQGMSPQSFRVAVAIDDVFHGYFPDVLDLLEARGAEVVDFSPLHDEQLPRDVDVVYLGCGQPERFASKLAANECMKLSLAQHVRSGGRIYAEGGGLPYVCSQLETADGHAYPMAGLLPAVARQSDQEQSPEPVEIVLSRPCWLGPPGTRFRGYLNSSWHIEPAPGLEPYVMESRHQRDVVAHGSVVGSRLHLNFAGQPDMLDRFCATKADVSPSELGWPGL